MKILIKPESADVLSRSTITGNTLTLPENLDRKAYTDVNAVIVAAGGKWNKKTKCHEFSEDPRSRLGLALDTGVIVDEVKARKKERQSFYTPEEIADDVAMCADVDGHFVLEPSAGDGNLAHACLKAGALGVDCVEFAEECRDSLAGFDSVTIADFLSVTPYTDFARIVMNPPFTRGSYVKHIIRAMRWLQHNGILTAITPDTSHPALDALGAVTLNQYPAGAFKESGTGIATRLIQITK